MRNVDYLSMEAAPPGATRHGAWCNRGCHAVVPDSFRKIHDDFHNAITYRKDGTVSNVLWCDLGDHPFKAGQPGSTHYQGNNIDDDGNTQTATIDACAQHNPFRAKPENIVKELNAEYPIPADPMKRETYTSHTFSD